MHAPSDGGMCCAQGLDLLATTWANIAADGASPDTLYTPELLSSIVGPERILRCESVAQDLPPTPSSPRTRADWPSTPSGSPARILDVMGFNERHREMYLGGRPGAAAKRANRTMARLAATGLTGWWLIRLDTVNPKSGTVLSLPW
jgi:hypothetical protein